MDWFDQTCGLTGAVGPLAYDNIEADNNKDNRMEFNCGGIETSYDGKEAPCPTWEREAILQAAWNSHVKVLEGLLEQSKANGGTTAASSTIGYGPTHFAAALGNLGVLELLLANGIDKDERDAEGNSPLIWVVTSDGPEEMLESLVDHGASINLHNFAGESALSLACQRGFASKAEYLLENGADSNSSNIDGATPLHAAAALGDAALVALLVRWGAHVNAVDHEGDSPLHWAVREDKHVAAQRLIELGADLRLANDDGENPIELLLACGDKDAADSLLRFARAKPAIRSVERFAVAHAFTDSVVMTGSEDEVEVLKTLSAKDLEELRTAASFLPVSGIVN